MYNEQLEQLIDAALTDGTLTEKEKQILYKKAMVMGVDLDEFEMVLEARLIKLKKEVEEKVASSAPKSNKHGDIRKCPACGAIVPQLTGFCKECGYEFSNVGVSTTSQLVADEIKKIKEESARKKQELRMSGLYSAEKKEGESYSPLEKAEKDVYWDSQYKIDSFIESFPIPNTKNDLLDFISFLRVEGYSKKRDQCLTKAKILFPDEPVFEKISAEIAEEKKKDDRYWALHKAGCLGLLVIIVIIVILGLILHWWTWADIRSFFD
jgi:molybdopterin synthase catalytic subunit